VTGGCLRQAGCRVTFFPNKPLQSKERYDVLESTADLCSVGRLGLLELAEMIACLCQRVCGQIMVRLARERAKLRSLTRAVSSSIRRML
jgi:hypothetical protein